MNIRKKQIAALGLALAVAGSAAGVGIYAANRPAAPQTAEEAPRVMEAGPETEKALRRDETVYVIANTDGSVRQIIVSDWIQNGLAAAQVEERSELSQVEAVKGSATYTLGQDNARVWDAQGQDLYYQGSIEKALPVDMTVTYQMDGQTVTPGQIAGKSGHVTIRFDYENRQYEMVEIDGTEEKIYVPFAMLTGLLLDSDRFTNVTVSNGKLFCDGSHTAVVGVAFPGLQEDLAMEKDRLDIPDYVEIEADVKDFSLATAVTVASSGLFDQLDDETLEKLELGELTDGIGRMTDAMDQLMDGSSQLYDGLCTLLDSSQQLIDGVDRLCQGLNELTAHNSQLNGGAKQVFESLIAAANSQLQASGLTVPELTVDNYSQVLESLLQQLDGASAYAESEARKKIEAAVAAQQEQVSAAVEQAVEQQVAAQVEQAVEQQVWQQVLSAAGLTEEAYDAGTAAGAIPQKQQEQLQAALKAQMASETIKGLISQTKAAKMESDEIRALIGQKTEQTMAELVEENLQSEEVQSQIRSAAEQASAGAQSIRSLKEQLDSYQSFYQGLLAYTAGVAQARDGAAQLQSSLPALTDGVTRLRDGSMELSDGLRQFREEGIQKLADALGGDLGQLSSRLKAIREAAQNYRSFSGDAEDMPSQVRFIYRMEAIEVQEND
ncbi:MAG: hypothetical protein Q4D08_03575 [Clostridia bacterium]|nr:hypothetical protein [Clostridia bacterium]